MTDLVPSVPGAGARPGTAPPIASSPLVRSAAPSPTGRTAPDGRHGDPGSGALAERLRAFLDTQLAPAGEAVDAVVDLRRTPAGLSRETWLFDLHVAGPDGARVEPLVLRRDPEGGGGVLDTDRELELRLLQLLEPAGVPTPVVAYHDLSGHHLGQPALLLRRDRGTCDYLVLNGDRPLADRLHLARELCGLLAQLHEEDWTALGLGAVLADPGPDAARTALDEWTTTLAVHGPGPSPELVAAALWLRSWAPPSPRTVLVHGDFKPGNTLIEGRAVSVLLDWETAHLGDPHEDLGWVTQPLRRSEHLIAGAWEEDDLLGAYTARTGFPVDRTALRWWQLFASFKTAIIQLTGLGAYLRGAGDRLFRAPADHLRILIDAMAADARGPSPSGSARPGGGAAT